MLPATAGVLGTGRGNGIRGRAVLVREGDADCLIHDVAGRPQRDQNDEDERDQDAAGGALLPAGRLGVDLLLVVILEGREATGKGLGRNRCGSGDGLGGGRQDVRDRVRGPGDLDVGVVGRMLLRRRRSGVLRVECGCGWCGRARTDRGGLDDCGGVRGRIGASWQRRRLAGLNGCSR